MNKILNYLIVLFLVIFGSIYYIASEKEVSFDDFVREVNMSEYNKTPILIVESNSKLYLYENLSSSDKYEYLFEFDYKENNNEEGIYIHNITKNISVNIPLNVKFGKLKDYIDYDANEVILIDIKHKTKNYTAKEFITR